MRTISLPEPGRGWQILQRFPAPVRHPLNPWALRRGAAENPGRHRSPPWACGHCPRLAWGWGLATGHLL